MNTINIAIVGHVDHGKSTLIGRLLHGAGGNGSGDPDSRLAHRLDHWEEERARGITMDTAQVFFHGRRRRVVLIDTPGHKEFMKNTLTGCSQAEAAVLVVDALEGIKDQTRRHAYILSLMGINRIIVAINKMDLLAWSKEGFLLLSDQVERLFRELGMEGRSPIIPISAREGENILHPSEKMAWYQGPSLLEALDDLTLSPPDEKELRFPVQGRMEIDGEKIIMGRVESGVLRPGARLKALPENRMITVAKAWKYGEEPRAAFGPGECMGLTLEEDVEISRGSVLTDNAQAQASNVVTATIFWMAGKPGQRGGQFLFRCATQEVPAKITQVFKKFDPGCQEGHEKDGHLILHGEAAEVELLLERPVVVDPFAHIPAMGRFVLESGTIPHAGGIVKNRDLC